MPQWKVDRSTAGEHYRALDDVLQLADIAGKS